MKKIFINQIGRFFNQIGTFIDQFEDLSIKLFYLSIKPVS